MKAPHIILIVICLIQLSCKNNDDQILNNSVIGDLEFAQNYGGQKNESGQSVVATLDGGYAILGYTQSTNGDITDKDEDSFDYWLLKFNASNELLWSKTYGGTLDDRGNDIVATQDGGFAITGYGSSNDNDISINNGNQDFWISKLDSDGNIIWEKSFGYSGSDRAYSIIQTQDQGFLISGVLDVTASAGEGNSKNYFIEHAGGDYWAIKLDSNGNQEWTKYFGGNLSDDPYGITQTVDGNFILVGSSDSEDVDITNNKGSYDYWIVSISNSGVLLWEKNFGGTEIDEARGITNTSDGNFLIIGNTRSNDVDVSNNIGGSDIWLLKISPFGELLWEKTLGGTGFDIGNSISKSINGYIISGASRSLDGNITGNNGQNDAFITEINENGDLLWTKSVGGSNEDLIYDSVQINDGTIVSVGETTSNDFDLNNNKGFTDLLVLKIK
ncbi:hypothetical protein [Aurantibacter sp.]|uniref:hypothetical protein n=1 Tax=Aurantibacter sp. TaxID=2807103 RepID=UPI0035C7FFB9